MQAPHYRKIELQSPADFTYLYANTVALSRRKLDLHLPPSAANNEDDTPDPMRERVRELVDEFINRTFTTASSSISINGLDCSSPQFPFPASFTAPETVEYEAYDTDLAGRVTSLYAQLESLTTTVAQLRRDAPGRAAKEYAEQLKRAIEEDENEDEDEDGDGDEEDKNEGDANGTGDVDVNMPDADENAERKPKDETDETENGATDQGPLQSRRRHKRRRTGGPIKPEWKLQVPLGTQHEADRWQSGEMAEVYEDALRTLLRLQGEAIPNGDQEANVEGGADSNALATTIGKAERAGRAAEIVEKT